MRGVKGVLSMRREPVLQALASGPLDTFEIAAATGIPKPGSILHTLMVERKVRRVGTRETGRRPLVVWERVRGAPLIPQSDQ
jgi:hypothetical protein